MRITDFLISFFAELICHFANILYLQVTMFGYNDKLKVLLATVIEKIAKFTVKLDRFTVIKVSPCMLRK